jgi:hypothetical protein
VVEEAGGFTNFEFLSSTMDNLIPISPNLFTEGPQSCNQQPQPWIGDVLNLVWSERFSGLVD